MKFGALQTELLIPEEELPVKAGLKVMRTNDPHTGQTEEEIQDRNEFIRCFLLQEFELLLIIPKQTAERDFFLSDYSVAEHEYSAFNTVDFQRRLRPFNRYNYSERKLLERVKELAIVHSSITSIEGRHYQLNRYEALIDGRLRNVLLRLAERHRRTNAPEEKSALKHKIGTLNRRILECKRIWERYAPPDRWDP